MSRPVSVLDGDRIREELADLKLTQRQFAQRLAMDEGDLSRALNGKPLQPTTIFRIAFGLAYLEPTQ